MQHYYCHCVANFNSIKVRLKPAASLGSAAAGVFQFHKGTIKTQVVAWCVRLYYRFQFHKGTIKTPKGARPYGMGLVNFNSIKVRLKRELKFKASFNT